MFHTENMGLIRLHLISRNETCEYMAQSHYVHLLRRWCTDMVVGRGGVQES